MGAVHRSRWSLNNQKIKRTTRMHHPFSLSPSFVSPVMYIILLLLLLFFVSPSIEGQVEPDRSTVLQEAQRRRLRWPIFSPIDQQKQEQLGIRSYSGKWVTLYTDLPSSDFISEIVPVLDAAVIALGDYFQIEIAEQNKDWHLDAFLMTSKEPFIRWGVLEGVPEFQFGYSMFNRIWVIDQKYDYYNRFLLIHELVHSLMFEQFGELHPQWFSEGIAEYLALHRWDNNTIELGIIPNSLAEVLGFNRMRTVRQQIQKGEFPSLDRIFRLAPQDYQTTQAYAWGWALLCFLDRHPRYRDLCKKIPYYMMTPNPTKLFLATLGEERLELEADWADFIANFDYCYEVEPSVIQYKKGKPLESLPNDYFVDVSSQQGWQSSGLLLEADKQYQLRWTGQMELFDPRGAVPCQAHGVTYQYVNDRPRGQLLLAILMDDSLERESRTSELSELSGVEASPWKEIRPLVSVKTFSPKTTGTLYFKINDRTENLSRNKGLLTVRVTRKVNLEM